MAEGNTKITDRFWTRYRELVRSEMIPYQWKVLNDEIDVRIERERDDAHIPNKKSHALENFRIAAGKHSGHHYGWVFYQRKISLPKAVRENERVVLRCDAATHEAIVYLNGKEIKSVMEFIDELRQYRPLQWGTWYPSLSVPL